MSPGDAWDAYVTAEQAADEAIKECGGSPRDGTPEGDRAVSLLDAADLAWSQYVTEISAPPFDSRRQALYFPGLRKPDTEAGAPELEPEAGS